VSNVIRTSEAATLALHAAAIIAGRPGAPVPTRVMAARLNASEAHLAKVMQRLARAGLVKGTRGPSGGFTLTRPPERISLREVYEAIEGQLDVQRCMFRSPVCGKDECPLGNLFNRLSMDVMNTLAGKTLADMEISL